MASMWNLWAAEIRELRFSEEEVLILFEVHRTSDTHICIVAPWNRAYGL